MVWNTRLLLRVVMDAPLPVLARDVLWHAVARIRLRHLGMRIPWPRNIRWWVHWDLRDNVWDRHGAIVDARHVCGKKNSMQSARGGLRTRAAACCRPESSTREQEGTELGRPSVLAGRPQVLGVG